MFTEEYKWIFNFSNLIEKSEDKFLSKSNLKDIFIKSKITGKYLHSDINFQKLFNKNKQHFTGSKKGIEKNLKPYSWFANVVDIDITKINPVFIEIISNAYDIDNKLNIKKQNNNHIFTFDGVGSVFEVKFGKKTTNTTTNKTSRNVNLSTTIDNTVKYLGFDYNKNEFILTDDIDNSNFKFEFTENSNQKKIDEVNEFINYNDVYLQWVKSRNAMNHSIQLVDKHLNISKVSTIEPRGSDIIYTIPRTKENNKLLQILNGSFVIKISGENFKNNNFTLSLTNTNENNTKLIFNVSNGICKFQYGLNGNVTSENKITTDIENFIIKCNENENLRTFNIYYNNETVIFENKILNKQDYIYDQTNYGEGLNGVVNQLRISKYS